jgi:hypothetical protein
MPLPDPRPLTLASVNRMSRAEFAAALGGVFEHSQWVAGIGKVAPSSQPPVQYSRISQLLIGCSRPLRAIPGGKQMDDPAGVAVVGDHRRQLICDARAVATLGQRQRLPFVRATDRSSKGQGISSEIGGWRSLRAMPPRPGE